MRTSGSRNGAGAGNVAMYLAGTVAFAVGVYLATVTRINLFTGRTTSPYLVVGIVLILGGLATAGAGRVLAKRRLVR